MIKKHIFFSLLFFVVFLSNFFFVEDSLSQTLYEVTFKVNDNVNYQITNCFDKKANRFLRLTNNKLKLIGGQYYLDFNIDNFFTESIKIEIYSDTLFFLNLTAKTINLNEVIVNSESLDKIKNIQNGMERISEKTLSAIPSLFGEKDIIKSLQLLPGITSTSEGASDLNVRGGTADQNLLLLGGIKIYNSSHFLGLISTFNSNIISYADIYKTGFPAKFGGKVSSVLDVKTISPNLKELDYNTTLGVISGSLFLNVPLKVDKSAFVFAARRSVIDLLMKIDNANSEQYKFNDFYFKNINVLNAKTNLEFSFYKDLDANSFTQKNNNFNDSYVKSGVVKGQFFFSGRLQKTNSKYNYDLTSFLSNYNLNITEENYLIDPDFLNYGSKNSIQEAGINYKSDLEINKNHHLNFGFDVIYSNYNTGQLTTNNSGEITKMRVLPQSNSLQYNFYLESDIKLSKKIVLRPGFRYNIFKTNTKSYDVIEPRFNLAYRLNPKSTLKFSYNKLFQPVQTLVNNGLGLPIDLIVPADSLITPQIAHQISFGLFKEVVISGKTFGVSVETYYNKQNNIITYKDGFDSRSFTIGSVLSVERWQDGVAIGNGNSHGLEFLLEKKLGINQGWISYTLSKVRHSFLDLDNGASFYPRQDRRHMLNVYQNLKLLNNWSFSYTFNYSSGQAITLPNSVVSSSNFIFPNNTILNRSVLIFNQGERGGDRIKPFHKLDISFKKQILLLKKYNAVLDLGVYNVYNRRNAYFYTLGLKNERDGSFITNIQSVSLLPILPYASLNLKFR